MGQVKTGANILATISVGVRTSLHGDYLFIYLLHLKKINFDSCRGRNTTLRITLNRINICKYFGGISVFLTVRQSIVLF